MAKSVKLADIAKQCGVSTVTVSKALSGQKGVSEEMREKIVQLARELGYKQPSAKKTREVASKNYNIAVLIHERYLDKYDSFYFRLYQNIASNAVSVGSFTTLEVVTNEAERSGDDAQNSIKDNGTLILPAIGKDPFPVIYDLLERSVFPPFY